MVGDAIELGGVAVGDDDDLAVARLDLLQVALHLLEDALAGGDGDDRQVLVDERDRPVLHLAGRIALGVDVGDLFQFQRPFEGHRVLDAAAEEEEVGRRVVAP